MAFPEGGGVVCGIAGFMALAPETARNEALLLRMLGALAHRGPDHEGRYVDGRAALGCRRLKIIDLEGGNQPIMNEDGSIVVVYNGEIYNYPELRADLAKAGHIFRTRCDTEVLVHLYEEHGEDMLSMLNGMFAFAIYDKTRRRILLARDRFGVKPLFYMRTPLGIYFASEIPALRTAPEFNADLDPEALAMFLAMFYIPSPWSIFRDVRRLGPGRALWIRAGEIRETRYHDFDFSKKERMTEREAGEEMTRLLSRSVERQLVADVPAAVFLSGGLDSGSLLAMARGAGEKPDSFTLSFDDRRYDEHPAAARWASRFARRSHRIFMREPDFTARLERHLKNAGEPVGPWINVGLEILSREAVRHGVRVALSGAGGDELYCGYPTLNAAVLARIYRRVPATIRVRFIDRLVNMAPGGDGPLPLSFMAKSFVNAIDRDDVRTFFNFKTVIPPHRFGEFLSPDMHEILKDASPRTAFERCGKHTGGWRFIDALSYIDLRNFLDGCVLHLGDYASMAASLELRTPFLDNHLAEFACKIPVHVKFTPFKVKSFLRRSMRTHLENSGGSDPVRGYGKRGFEMPANLWIRRGRLRDYLRRRLSREAMRRLNVFDPVAVENVLSEHIAGRRNNERIIQAILGVVLFFETL